MELIETREYKMDYNDFIRRIVQKKPETLCKAGFILRERKQIYNTAYAEWDEESEGTPFYAENLSEECDGEEIELMSRVGGEISLHYNCERKTVRVSGRIDHSGSDVKKKLRSDLENLLHISINRIDNSFSLILSKINRRKQKEKLPLVHGRRHQ
ncbi:MAG: hypothetical protein AABX16_03660 [Nanoarchaeota archaeon]|mgnify:CR=1